MVFNLNGTETIFFRCNEQHVYRYTEIHFGLTVVTELVLFPSNIGFIETCFWFKVEFFKNEYQKAIEHEGTRLYRSTLHFYIRLCSGLTFHCWHFNSCVANTHWVCVEKQEIDFQSYLGAC